MKRSSANVTVTCKRRRLENGIKMGKQKFTFELSEKSIFLGNGVKSIENCVERSAFITNCLSDGFANYLNFEDSIKDGINLKKIHINKISTGGTKNGGMIKMEKLDEPIFNTDEKRHLILPFEGELKEIVATNINRVKDKGLKHNIKPKHYYEKTNFPPDTSAVNIRELEDPIYIEIRCPCRNEYTGVYRVITLVLKILDERQFDILNSNNFDTLIETFNHCIRRKNPYFCIENTVDCDILKNLAGKKVDLDLAPPFVTKYRIRYIDLTEETRIDNSNTLEPYGKIKKYICYGAFTSQRQYNQSRYRIVEKSFKEHMKNFYNISKIKILNIQTVSIHGCIIGPYLDFRV